MTAMAPVSKRFREEGLLTTLRCFLLLALFVFIPSAMRYQLEFSSVAPGLIVSCAAMIGFAAIGLFDQLPMRRLLTGWLLAIAVLTAIAGHLGLGLFFQSADLDRAFTSLGGVAIMLAAACVFAVTFYRADDRSIHDATAIALCVFPIAAALGLVGIQPISNLASERPAYPFTEPSHLALAALPFFIDGAVRARGLVKWAILGVMLLLVLILQSLSLGVGVVITAICALRIRQMVPFIIVAVVAMLNIDLSYYLERLDFSSTNTNLSTLVYLQGIELMQEGLEKTGGWGIGFQQLGYAPTNVLTTEIIRRVGGGEQNLSDGSFLAVKFIAELGVLGIAAIGAYLFVAARAVWRLRAIATDRIEATVAVTFAHAAFVALAVELFVRGIGYFSGTFLLAIASLGVVTGTRIVRADTDRGELSDAG